MQVNESRRGNVVTGDFQRQRLSLPQEPVALQCLLCPFERLVEFSGVPQRRSVKRQSQRGRAISKALFSDSVIPLNEIDDVLKFQRTKAALAYEESYSFTAYLVENYDFEKMIELIQGLQTEKTFEHVFRDIYGIDIFEAEIAWYQYIEKKYRWHFLLDFENFLWISILLLFFLVFLIIKLRNRHTLKKWSEEERWVKS